ncbi:MAG: S41 family peptidase [Pseudomonadota bacterium]
MNRTCFLSFACLPLLLGAGPALGEDAPWQRTVSTQALQEDFATLYRGLRNAHADLFVHRSEADYEALYTKTLASLTEPMSLFDAHVRFQQFTAYGNVAHARLEFPSAAYQAFQDSGGRTFPIYLRLHEGRAYVDDNRSGHPRPRPGDELLTLNGVAISEWLERVAEHISADTPYIAHSLLEFTFARYLWLEAGEVASFTLGLRDAQGEPYEVMIEALGEQAQREIDRTQPGRFTLNSDERTARMLDDATAYLRPGPFYNAENPNALWDNSAYLRFIDQAFADFLEARAQTLIIDLRDNPGGDNSFSDPLLAWFADAPFRFCSAFLIRSSDEAAASNQTRLDASADATAGVSAAFAREYAKTPRGQQFAFEIPLVTPRVEPRFEGQVVVLINRHSYSNAVNVAATVQDYGFGVIAGEKTADMATTYGAMETFTLPNTGLAVGFPKAHIIRPSGDRRVDGVTPDWPIASPITPSTEDVVLASVRKRIAP